MKKIFKVITSVLTVGMLAISTVGCNNGEIIYTDREERPTIQQPVVSEFVKYPEIPAQEPVVDSETPSVSGYETSKDSYTMTETIISLR